MSTKVAASRGLVVLLALGGGLAAQERDVARELGEARRLYQDANFSEAAIKLQGTIDYVRRLQDPQTRKSELADAHLLLALSYFAMDDHRTAKIHLRDLLRLDPAQRLDPQVYAPPVIALFEGARREIIAESSATPGVKTVGQKKRSKAPLVIGGIGAAAAAGVAATRSSPGAAPPPTPRSTAAALGPETIRLDSIAPSPGSTVKVGFGGVLVRLTATVVFSRSGTFHLWAQDRYPNPCIGGGSGPLSIVAGQPQTATINVNYPVSGWEACPLPFSVGSLGISLGDPNSPVSECCVIQPQQFPVFYRFVE